MVQDEEKKNEGAPARNVVLYNLAIGPAAKCFPQIEQELEGIPGSVLMDIFMEIAETGNLDEIVAVKKVASELSTFLKLMHQSILKGQLHKFLQILINREIMHTNESREAVDIMPLKSYRQFVLNLLPARLAANYEEKAMKEMSNAKQRDNLIKIGMEIGEFLSEVGWFEESAKVLNQCMYVCLAEDSLDGYKRSVPCLERLLKAQVSYSLHPQAKMTYETANLVIKKLSDAGIKVNLAGMYQAFSTLHYLECSFSEALDWSIKALEELKGALQCTDPQRTIDILRQAAKSCLVKREFHKAELLIKEAVYLARDVYGSKSVKYSDALLDYGFYLVNRDSAHQSVQVYRECLEIRKTAFGINNLMTALVIEDLAYALYVTEYNTGKFDEARSLSERAIKTMTLILQPSHLQFASVKRVQALILEEIAIDSQGGPQESQYLEDAEKLHLQALELSKQVFGELNVQIAKHYGNLGRLYQSMKKYKEAEEMHLKAISIKENLLGAYDYEVALSLGHLASLYNYDMEEYRKAEELHLRSISIGKRLFGEAYSGLEYDYRGLMQIYFVEGNHDQFEEYERIFTQWRMLRDLNAANGPHRPISESQVSQPVKNVLDNFFSMEWINIMK